MLNAEISLNDIQDYYTRYGPMIFKRCRQLLKDEEMAKDAIQDVFVKLLLHSGRLKVQFPSTLIFRISTNVCLNMLRALRIRQTVANDDMIEKIATYDENEKKTAIYNLLDGLFKKEKPSTREMAVMLFVDGMTLKEVAIETGLSVSGVRRRIREFRTRVQTSGGMEHEN